MSIVPGPDMSKISFSSRWRDQLTASPIIGYSVTPRWKKSPRSPSLDLAQHVDGGDRELAFARLRLRADLGDDADHQRVAGVDAEKLADGRAQFLRADREAHLRLAAGDREHAPEGTALRNMVHARLPERFSRVCSRFAGLARGA